MATTTVRNVDDALVATPKSQARENRRSLEEEVRHLLAQQMLRRERMEAFRARTARLAALTADRSRTDSTLLLREDRDPWKSLSMPALRLNGCLPRTQPPRPV